MPQGDVDAALQAARVRGSGTMGTCGGGREACGDEGLGARSMLVEVVAVQEREADRVEIPCEGEGKAEVT